MNGLPLSSVSSVFCHANVSTAAKSYMLFHWMAGFCACADNENAPNNNAAANDFPFMIIRLYLFQFPKVETLPEISVGEALDELCPPNGRRPTSRGLAATDSGRRGSAGVTGPWSYGQR